MQGDGADGVHGLPFEDRSQRDPAVFRLPKPAGGGGHVEHVHVLVRHRQVHDAAAHGRGTDGPELQASEVRGVQGLARARGGESRGKQNEQPQGRRQDRTGTHGHRGNGGNGRGKVGIRGGEGQPGGAPEAHAFRAVLTPAGRKERGSPGLLVPTPARVIRRGRPGCPASQVVAWKPHHVCETPVDTVLPRGGSLLASVARTTHDRARRTARLLPFGVEDSRASPGAPVGGGTLHPLHDRAFRQRRGPFGRDDQPGGWRPRPCLYPFGHLPAASPARPRGHRLGLCGRAEIGIVAPGRGPDGFRSDGAVLEDPTGRLSEFARGLYDAQVEHLRIDGSLNAEAIALFLFCVRQAEAKQDVRIADVLACAGAHSIRVAVAGADLAAPGTTVEVGSSWAPRRGPTRMEAGPLPSVRPRRRRPRRQPERKSGGTDDAPPAADEPSVQGADGWMAAPQPEHPVQDDWSEPSAREWSVEPDVPQWVSDEPCATLHARGERRMVGPRARLVGGSRDGRPGRPDAPRVPRDALDPGRADRPGRLGRLCARGRRVDVRQSGARSRHRRTRPR